ncbi:MAG: hypothetical protein DBY25_08010 [Clostridiales bacterium]|nr:MAG: hypothetical protein DBY25_08010 [Clostridiales bacterium]
MRPFCYESPKPVGEELYFVVLSGRVGGHAPTTDASESSTTDKFMYYSRYRLPIQPEQRQAALLVEQPGSSNEWGWRAPKNRVQQLIQSNHCAAAESNIHSLVDGQSNTGYLELLGDRPAGFMKKEL